MELGLHILRISQYCRLFAGGGVKEYLMKKSA